MRTLNRIYAWLFGYFWLPCPVCHRMFGGHEAGFGALIAEDERSARGVCDDPQCTHEAAIQNMARGHAQFIREPSSLHEAS